MKCILSAGAASIGVARLHWRMVALVLLGTVGATLGACSRSQAQPPTAGARCEATVSVAGTEQACPVGGVRFRLSVTGCQRSSGNFSYKYQLVDEGHKINATGIGAWRSGKAQWEQTERVPMECGLAIEGIDEVRATSCSCAGD